MLEEINKVVEGTQVFVISYDPETKNYTWSRPFSVEEARALALDVSTSIQRDYKGVSGLRQGLSVGERTGELCSMNTLKGIVANKILAQGSEGTRRLHTVREMVGDNRAGMLRQGILIDGGIAVYSGEDPDKSIAQGLVAALKGRGYELPVLLSFNALDLSLGGERYGATPIIVPNGEIMSGEAAMEFLRNNHFVTGNSGVRRLCRGDGGRLIAYWEGRLGCFDDDCRVGRFVTFGDVEELREEALGFLDRQYQAGKRSFDEITASRSR
jgi:hypothetical protein